MVIGNSIVHFTGVGSLYNSVWKELNCSISQKLWSLGHKTLEGPVRNSLNTGTWR